MLRSVKDSLVYQYSKACMTFHRLSLYRHIGGLPYRHTVGFWVAVAHAGTISGVLMPYRSDKERTCVYHRTLDTTEHTVISAAPILYRQGTVWIFRWKLSTFILFRKGYFIWILCLLEQAHIYQISSCGCLAMQQALCRKTKTSQRNTHKKPWQTLYIML